jgi:crotonobetainyl-CoA:carnitine CoA-transferase CaiB-like acyl-CoA transferase
MSAAVHLPLQGMRVVDLTHVWSGPMATRVLAALGADVLKIEAPQRPDFLRGSGAGDVPGRYPDLEPGAEARDRNAWFNTQNTDKRSVVLDLKDARGKDALLSLVAESDVVASNFRPGVLERMGLDYAALTRARDDIVLLEMPGYGSSGPMKRLAGYGAQFEARSGSAFVMGSPDAPVLTGFALADPTAGLSAAGAVVTALAMRRRTGKGCRIELVQREAMLPLVGEHLVARSVGLDTYGELNAEPGSWWQSIVGLRDGSWLLVRLEAPEQAVLVARNLGGVCMNPTGAEIARRLGQLDDARSVAARLQELGVAAAPVASLDEVFDDEALRESGFYVPLDHAAVGVRDHPGFPGTVAGVRPGPRRAAPRFGEHTEHVLTHVAGMDRREVERLATDHVIRTLAPSNPAARTSQSASRSTVLEERQ